VPPDFLAQSGMENTNIDVGYHIATLASESAEQLTSPVLWALPSGQSLTLRGGRVIINCLTEVGNGVHKHWTHSGRLNGQIRRLLIPKT
jgi:hypothetical protein